MVYRFIFVIKESFQSVCLLILISILMSSAASAFIHETNTQYVTQTILLKINWGKTNIGTFSSNGANNSRAMGGTSPNLDNMKIKSISVYLGAQTGNVRLAVYCGGQLNDPTSATLLWDAGTVNPNGVAGWYTINHPAGGVSWPKNTVTWLAWKLNTGVSLYAHTVSSEAGNFQTQRGRNNNNFNQDPSVAFPSTYGQQGTFANYWYSIYVTYVVEV
jgi:hypothetical protein